MLHVVRHDLPQPLALLVERDRDCVMGRLYGWDWRPASRWEFCEAIGEQGRSAWVPVPADAPRTEPCEVGTDGAPLVHPFYRDGTP